MEFSAWDLSGGLQAGERSLSRQDGSSVQSSIINIYTSQTINCMCIIIIITDSNILLPHNYIHYVSYKYFSFFNTLQDNTFLNVNKSWCNKHSVITRLHLL